MKELVSIIIPSYKDVKLIPRTLDKLLENSYPFKEVLVVIDEPTSESLQTLGKYNGKIDLIVNEKRMGKVRAYEKALERARGEYLIFLDDDVEVVDKDFIEEIVRKLKEADIVDIKKEIKKKSILSRLVYYDYIAMNFANYLFHRWLNRCIGINGAAFAIRKKALEKIGGFNHTVSEDLDLGVRAYVHELKFVFLNELKVLNEAPSSWRSWFRQRKRWAIGAALWIKQYFRTLVSILKNNLRLSLFTIFMLFPNLLVFVISLFLEENIFYKLALLLLFYLSSYLPVLLPLFTLVSYSLAFLPIKAMTVATIGFVFYSLIYYYAARKLGHKFNILEFMLYYFIYSPIWMFIFLAGLFRVLVLKKTGVEDWII